MREDVGAVLDARAPGPGGLSRVVKWSFGVHVAVALSVLAWQAFLSRSANHATEMTINMSGQVGPSTGGLNALPGRQVDVATPQPKRPDPPVAPKPDEMTIPAKSVIKPAVPKKDSTVSQSSVVTPQATGRVVTAGSSVIDTGARGQSSGLSQGGGTGAQVDPNFTFCCSEYITKMQAELNTRVNWAQEKHGTVVVSFQIRRDGTIDPASVKVDKSTGESELEFDAQHAVRISHMPKLPDAYKENSLIVHVTFPY